MMTGQAKLISCADAGNQLITIFNRQTEVKAGGIVGTSIGEITDTLQNNNTRVCGGKIAATNRKVYKVTYKVYLQNGGNFVQIVDY